MKFLLVLLFVSCALAAEKPQAEKITEHLQKKNWAAAESELQGYIEKNPEKSWAYSSRAWALENLKRYDEAITVAREGTRRWPSDGKMKTALSRVLLKKAETMPSNEAHPFFEEAALIDPREYTEFSLARSYRNSGAFVKAIQLMEKGAAQYPQSEQFRAGLPFTHYQYFKQLRAINDATGMRSEIKAATDKLSTGSYDQYYYKLILRFGLRELSDRVYFQKTYDQIFARHPQNAALHDDYGFQLYANYRIHGQPDKELRETAISWRRKAYDLYWQNRKLPAPVTGLGHPLKGRNAVWSEFGGSAMTHNGFSQYCYDFAAVDKARSIAIPGSSRKKNSDYYMFGKPVFAVAEGTVSGVINEFPDNEPGGFSGDANTITIKHHGYLSFYAHLKDKGVVVKEGQRVKKGALIGYVGNSGMSSESHLHFCINADGPDDITLPFNFAKTTVEKKDGSQSESSAFYKEDDIVIFK